MHLASLLRSQLALSQPAEAHHVADDDEMEADEQPEESEIDDDEEVEPDSRQKSRQAPAGPSKEEGNERDMDEQGDDEEPDDEEREDGGDLEDDDGFGEEAEEEAKEEQAEDLDAAPTRDGLENESEAGHGAYTGSGSKFKHR